MSGVGGQGREIDAEFAEGALPFAIDLAVEEDFLVGGNMQPAILLQFTVELVRSPAGIAEGEQAPARSLAAPDGAQDLERRREREIVADDERFRFRIVRRMQNKTAARFDGATEVNPRRFGEPARRDVQLG